MCVIAFVGAAYTAPAEEQLEDDDDPHTANLQVSKREIL